MELLSSSRSMLSSCNRLVAPSRTASSAAKRDRKSGLVCVLGGERGSEGKIGKRSALALVLAIPALSVPLSAHGKTKSMTPYDERRLLQQNKKIQEANRAPDDFPNFIREGFQVKVVTPDNYVTRDSGLIYEDVKIGTGFEEGIRDMKPGGKRRLIIPPELGPPVGPSTFFSAKQFEVFDVELLSVKDCERRTIGFYSDVVCS
ncbi:peptidyl-prolyl cis-trans isomerase FKBP20-2, chloroplastic isoform X3 [Brachypodium distachyon]|uniref:peptidyl-prolyl cis-trans isomerase FKBP20-2, chloroplastic isoform X3 n=1 Tax=Brachypodium distachyon TaxID=15368 RepID=UPI00052FE32B|nr:peptidyl-prolyl cis-trans isomerase FKBP20-2, chloroplastic isoform X3 [Brachypodium distachyon]|eukprot:XP_010238178.1 peptidyl-prolyl cis-trans isomerase FKBP20-2, chloroplastic isoform X3 [Brachypodium distachyon]